MTKPLSYSNVSSYNSLQDYVRLFRRQRWLIIGTVLVFVALGLGYSLKQPKRYTATAQLTFRDVTQDFGLLGSNVLPALQPAQQAAANAAVITRPAVVSQVKQRLAKVNGLTPSERALSGTSVGAQVNTVSNLVELTTTADAPRYAAEVSNAFAQATVRDQTRQGRARIGEAANALKAKMNSAGLTRRTTPGGSLIRQEIAQLETLQRIAQPVQITQAATAPTVPSSPRIKLNTFLAGMVGFVFGVCFAFVRDALDRRLRAPRDVHDELDYPLLARIRDDALGKSLVVSNGKGPAPESEFEPFRILRTNLEFLDRSGEMRSVMVTSGLPEEGKSTVALSLAASSAIAGKRTLLVECDLRRPSLARRLGIAEAPGLREYLAEEAQPQEIVQTFEVSGPSMGNNGTGTKAHLVCITAGRIAANGPELLGSDRCRDFFKQVSSAYELVVVDTGPLLAVVDPMQLVQSVDGLLLCVRLQRVTRDEARATRQVLERLPQRPTGIVLTGVKGGGDELYGYYSYAND